MANDSTTAANSGRHGRGWDGRIRHLTASWMITALLAAACAALAEDRLELHGGETLDGRVVGYAADVLTFETAARVRTYSRPAIAAIALDAGRTGPGDLGDRGGVSQRDRIVLRSGEVHWSRLNVIDSRFVVANVGRFRRERVFRIELSPETIGSRPAGNEKKDDEDSGPTLACWLGKVRFEERYRYEERHCKPYTRKVYMSAKMALRERNRVYAGNDLTSVYMDFLNVTWLSDHRGGVESCPGHPPLVTPGWRHRGQLLSSDTTMPRWYDRAHPDDSFYGFEVPGSVAENLGESARPGLYVIPLPGALCIEGSPPGVSRVECKIAISFAIGIDWKSRGLPGSCDDQPRYLDDGKMIGTTECESRRETDQQLWLSQFAIEWDLARLDCSEIPPPQSTEWEIPEDPRAEEELLPPEGVVRPLRSPQGSGGG